MHGHARPVAAASGREPGVGLLREYTAAVVSLDAVSIQLDEPCLLAVCSGAVRVDDGVVSWSTDEREAIGFEGGRTVAVRALAPSTQCLVYRTPQPWPSQRAIAMDPGARILPLSHGPDARLSQTLIALANAVERTHGRAGLPAPARHFASVVHEEQAPWLKRIDALPGRTRWRRWELFARLSRARSLLRDIRQPHLAIADVAAISCISPSHFVRLYHACFGESPHAERIRFRMEKAQRLLADGAGSVGDVMQRVGVQNAASFARSFRSVFGRTASSYLAPQRESR